MENDATGLEATHDAARSSAYALLESSANTSMPAQTKSTDQQSAEIARLWYVHPKPLPPRGWLVYSSDFILAALQGCVAHPEEIRRTSGWKLLAGMIRFFMAPAQASIMLISRVPVIAWMMEIMVRVFGRNAVGFFLRACYWKARLRHIGQDTIIDRNVDIWGASNVSIGARCHIDTNVRMAAGEKSLGQHGSIVIGDYVHLGPGVHLAGRGGIEIQDLVGISADAHLYSATGVVEYPADPGRLISMSHVAPQGMQHVFEAPIVIEEYAFVGMMARIMPGVRIGRAAVVHANTELTRSVPAFANYGGMPRGRQVGWRRPRRPSPLLQAPPPAGESAP